jgi:uncharacterized membrane protein
LCEFRFIYAIHVGALHYITGSANDLGKSQKLRNSPTITFMLSAIMAALVTVSTYIVQIPVPATSGYINIGDVMVFTSALVFGPLVGGIAGGLGSSLADMLGGYWTFVPITFVVKGLEGLISGSISNGRNVTRDALAVLVGGVVMISGYFLAETYLLGYGSAAFLEVPGNISQITVGGLVGIPASYAVRKLVHSFNIRRG